MTKSLKNIIRLYRLDEYDCSPIPAHEGMEPDYEDIEDAVCCLTENIPYAAIGTD